MNNILKSYCRENNISITDLAGLVRLPVPTVWRHVNGKFNPSALHALLYEKATGISVSEIISNKSRGADTPENGE